MDREQSARECASSGLELGSRTERLGTSMRLKETYALLTSFLYSFLILEHRWDSSM